jgi:Dyp-type peroxidase family
MSEPHRPSPAEPVLPMTDIQGLVVPGFAKQHQTLLGVQIPAGRQVINNFKKLLREFSREVSTAKVTLDNRRERRQLRMAKTGHRKESSRIVLFAVGFSYPGLLKLSPGAQDIRSVAFREGLARRSAMLGDPTKPTDEGNPTKWKVGGSGNELDALFVVAGDRREDVTAKASELAAKLKGHGADVVYNEDGDVRDDLPGHEHFGFDDGVSQPGIRGRATDAADDFVTPRHISADRIPEHSLFGYPGQDLIWPGELVLGHEASSPDPLFPGTVVPALPEWTRNGSFLVFRRLRQDVGLFWNTMADLAGKLGKTKGFEDMTDERLASRMVGRWPSGAPVNRVPETDDPELGKKTEANNHFRFDSDAAKLPLDPAFDDTFPMSKADPAGISCPWAAHIRKVNTRDSGSDLGGRDSTYRRRILRVGIPFGKPLKNRYADKAHDPEKGERGLLFLSVQSSIEEQFEFLVARWMGDPSRPKMPGGHDLLVGQNDTPGEARLRRCVLFGKDLEQANVETIAQWIIPTGGGYFFVPSHRALSEVLGQ